MRYFLLAIYTMFSLVLFGQEEAVTIDTLLLDNETIIISENRLKIPFSDVSRSIEILDKKEIKALQANSINELLQSVGGVDLRQRGVNGVQGDLSIRGGTFEQALVLINGIKMLDPQTGHHLMNLPITIEDIERIEVLKGPGARVYGQNAYSGAINIITKTAMDFGATAGIERGSYGLMNVFASVDAPVADLNQKFSISHNSSDGYRENTDYDMLHLFYQGQVARQKGDINIMAGHTSRNFGANGFYGNESFTEQYEETRTTFGALSMKQRAGNWTVEPKLSWRQNKDNWQFRRSDPEFFQNFHTSKVLTGEIQSQMVHGSGMLGIGVELNKIDLESNNLGTRERTQLGFHLENRFLLMDERLDITPGIYLLQISDFGTQFFPGIDLGYRLSNRSKLFVNAGRTSRIPSFTDLYYEDRGNLGNPNLETESAFTFEFGGNIKSNNTFFQASYFRRSSSDLIDWFKINPDDRWMPDNFGNATFSGLDFTIEYRDRLGTSFLQNLKASYLFLDARLNETDDIALSRNVLENLKHQLILQTNFRLHDQLSLNLLYKYNDRASLEDYMLLDANLQYTAKQFTIFAKANNLFGTSYRETNLVPMPGRWMVFGARFTY